MQADASSERRVGILDLMNGLQLVDRIHIAAWNTVHCPDAFHVDLSSARQAIEADDILIFGLITFQIMIVMDVDFTLRH